VTFTYDPSKIGERSKDRMRFELGDTDVSGGEDTAAVSDEEISAVLAAFTNWKRAKLALVESICSRMSFEVDTKVGPMTLSLSGRAVQWSALYEKLKKEVGAMGVPSGIPGANTSSPYFYAGMQSNERSENGGE